MSLCTELTLTTRGQRLLEDLGFQVFMAETSGPVRRAWYTAALMGPRQPAHMAGSMYSRSVVNAVTTVTLSGRGRSLNSASSGCSLKTRRACHQTLIILALRVATAWILTLTTGCWFHLLTAASRARLAGTAASKSATV